MQKNYPLQSNVGGLTTVEEDGVQKYVLTMK